jgi:hypothetical protein
MDTTIDIDESNEVKVTERIILDQAWFATVRDSLGEPKQFLKNYQREAKERGGKSKTFGGDSARTIFKYDSPYDFAYFWPDTNDNRLLYDRAVYRQTYAGETLVHELVIFRMSPPDPAREKANQRYPILTFTLNLPVAAAYDNAHSRSGNSYHWQFTERLTAPDSVLIAWPVADTP